MALPTEGEGTHFVNECGNNLHALARGYFPQSDGAVAASAGQALALKGGGGGANSATIVSKSEPI